MRSTTAITALLLGAAGLGCGSDDGGGAAKPPPSMMMQPSTGLGGAGGAVPMGAAGGMAGASPGVTGMAGAPITGTAGAAGMMMTAGMAGMAGMMGAMAGSTPMEEAGSGGMATEAGSGGMMEEAGSDAPPMGEGMCCDDGDCLCHGPDPTALTSMNGPYDTDSYTISGVGCVYYPTDAEPPFAAVAVSDGFLGSGGCGSFQTGQWGPFYASWGIVAMIVNTGSSDQPSQRARALAKGVEAFKSENTKSGSPLEGKMAGRYGTSGFSMGGGGTTIAAADDATLLTDVAIMPWGPATRGVTVPTLVICGSSDGTAPCSSHGTPAYRGIADTVPKMRVQISSGHAGQPSSGRGASGQVGLAFQKVFLENDQRWRPLLVGADSEETNIK